MDLVPIFHVKFEKLSTSMMYSTLSLETKWINIIQYPFSMKQVREDRRSTNSNNMNQNEFVIKQLR
jgi:hypothetical protein